MRKIIVTVLVVALVAVSALGQSQDAPTLRIESPDGNSLPSELFYGNTKVKPLRLRPGTTIPITINDADFFVQQQYVDFLSRFPDTSGFNFWTGQIEGCGGDAQCTLLKRVNTSGAFFLSIEFQNTGYFVYRLYKSSLGRRPNFTEFMPEARLVSSGVIVNQDGWQQKLEQNKNDFASAWVTRADFRSAYDGLSNAAYVDKLIATAGITNADVNRDALVNGLNSGTETRVSVLRKVAESAAFDARERNPAFVQMQYFGYLRRDPDTDGFNFWLAKLNQFSGDFVGAQMVEAFIVSGEYRDRF